MKFWYFLVCCLSVFSWQTNYAEESPPKKRIVTVDIPYELFNALVEYEELHRSKANNTPANLARMVTTLNMLVAEYERELAKFQAFALDSGAMTMLEPRLKRMQQNIDDFRNELKFYRALLKYQQLKDKQDALLEAK
jgi:hypothetical protein